MSKQKKRLLIVGSTDLITPHAGKQFVWRGFLDYLRSKSGQTEILYIDTSFAEGNSTKLADVGPVVTLSGRSRVTALLQALGNLLIGNPLQLGVWYSRAHAASIAKIAAEFNPDIVIFDTIRAGLYLRHVKDGVPDARLALFLDDLTSLRYSQLSKSAGRNSASPLDRLGDSVLPVLSFLSKSPKLQRLAYAYESVTLRRWEERLIKQAGVATLMSRDEVDLSSKQSPGSDVRVMPVRCKSHINDRYPSVAEVPEYVLIGDWKTPHNRDALMNFCELAPSLQNVTASFHIKLFGRGAPDQALDALNKLGSRFAYHGYAPDLRDVYGRAWYALVPVRVATGVRVKVIEAWSWGVPLLTTAAGVRGMPFKDGVNGTQFSDGDSLAAAITRLSDAALQKNLGLGATDTFLKNYDIAEADARYSGILGL